MKMVVMAGGQGTRFWPLSRRSRPKQFLSVIGEKSLFQLTIERLERLVGKEDIFVVCSGEYLPLVLEQAPGLHENQMIVEPVPRNTAPCIGLAACCLNARFPGEVMGIFPSDHLIMDEDEFRKAALFSAELAGRGHLVTFGIKPDFPATGYGYLEKGELMESREGIEAYQVARFTEKPALENAMAFLESGRYLWNSGMFFWSITAILEAIRNHLPELSRILEGLGDCGSLGQDARELFASAESVSIDYGVMEKSDKVVVVPCDLQWDDVGDWNSVAEILEGPGNSGFSGAADTIEVDSSNCFVLSRSGKKVALAGVHDLILVETEDSILVCSRNSAQDVGKIVKVLKEKHPELV